MRVVCFSTFAGIQMTSFVTTICKISQRIFSSANGEKQISIFEGRTANPKHSPLYLSCSAARQDMHKKSSAFGVRRCSSFLLRRRYGGNGHAGTVISEEALIRQSYKSLTISYQFSEINFALLGNSSYFHLPNKIPI
jgi:hypothetical protein